MPRRVSAVWLCPVWGRFQKCQFCKRHWSGHEKSEHSLVLAAFVVCRGEHHPVYGIQSYTSWHYTDMVAHIRIHRAVPKIIDGMGLMEFEGDEEQTRARGTRGALKARPS